MRVEGSAEKPDGGDMLQRLSNEMVRAQKRFFGKGPTSAKSYVFDDLLLVVMRGGMTIAEHTMIEFEREEEVRRFRQAFEDEMTERLTSAVEEITGRKVLTYQSQIMFDPDLIIEFFVFDDDLSNEPRGGGDRGRPSRPGSEPGP